MNKLSSLLIFATLSIGLIAISGVMPAASAANANLFVSAENSQFDNYMSGPQVIEVIVMDENIDDTDIPRGEPDVTVNGKVLRMVQAIDGNWYGYFADRDMAQIADSTVLGMSENTIHPTIPLDGSPFNLAINSDSNLIYVTHYNSVSVIDGTTNSVISTIPLSNSPTNLAINSDSNLIYVTHYNSDNVTVIDGTTNSVISTISLGGNPSNLAINSDSNLIYVTNVISLSVSVIDGTTNSVISTIPLSNSPTNLAINSDSNLIYVTHRDSDNVTVIDGTTNSVISTIPVGDSPFNLAINSDSNLIYVVNYNSDNVTVIDGTTNSVISTIPVGDSPFNLAINSDSNLIYVVNRDSDNVTVIDGTTNSVISTIPVYTNHEDLAINSDSNLIYVIDVDYSFVTVIDGTTNSVISTIPLSNSPTNLAINSDSNLIYVTHYNSDNVTVIDGTTNTVLGSYTVPATGVFGIGLDYGNFCDGNDGSSTLGFNLSDTDGFAVSNIGSIYGGQIGSSYGGAIFGTNCSFNSEPFVHTMNVVRESKDVNPGNGEVLIGQIGLNSVDNWPFIQLYDISQTGSVIVQYNKGGGAQSTTLTFDTVDQFANLTLDKSEFSRNSQIHVTITDLWLNIDPTDEDSWTFGTNSANGLTSNYQVFNENGGEEGASVPNGIIDVSNNFDDLMIEDNGVLILNVDQQSSGTNVVTIQDTLDTVITCSIPQDISTCTTSDTAAGLGINSQPITITEQGPNSGVFVTYDEADESVLLITDNAKRGTSATIDYNETPRSIVVAFDYATIDIIPIDNEWNSGEEILLELKDEDANKNSRADEDLDFYNPDVEIIPSLQTGNPFTLESLSTAHLSNIELTVQDVQSFSHRAMLDSDSNSIAIEDGDSLVLVMGDTFADLYESINNPSDNFRGFNFFHYDLRSLQYGSTIGTIVSFDIDITDGTKTARLASNVNSFSDNLIDLSTATGDDIFLMNTFSPVQIIFTFETITGNPVTGGGIILPAEVPPTIIVNTVLPIASDFFSFGIIDDGLQSDERIANQIIRIEVEETGDNTGTFVGSLEYKMLNQINILSASTYSSMSPITDEPTFIVIEDLTDEDALRVYYLDLGQDGLSAQISDQEEAPTHSGVISFDSNSYKIGDNVNVTLLDMDLNTNSDLIDIFTVVDPSLFPTDPARDTIGKEGLGLYSPVLGEFGRLVDVKFDEHRWTSGLTENGGSCGVLGEPDDGLHSTGFTLVETGPSTGIFIGDFDVPLSYCNSDTGLIEMTIGADIEINYVDFRDASGEIIEVGDSASIRANTGSVSLDRTVYPVPWGQITDFDDPLGDQVTPAGSNPDETRSLVPIHATGITDGNLDEEHETLGNGDLIIHIRVNDPDFDLAEFGEDTIQQDVKDSTVGPVKISIIRDSEEIILGYAGGSTPNTNGVIDVNADATGSELDNILQLGAIYEIAPDAGIFEIDFTIRYTDGPDSTLCPDTDNYVGTDGAIQNTDPLIRFDTLPINEENFCILQGDIITVEYTDPADASGEQNIVTDSAIFDLRNGVLQSDKSVYTIGSDMILTLIEPDFDLDNGRAETYDLDLIEWDSDAATLTIGDAGGEMSSFDPEPSHFRETGDSTGIFQVVLAIPSSLNNDNLERGEEIILEYNDWGPTLGNYVGEQKIDVNVTIFTSNFGATVKLDQSVYTWTDDVFITIVAPDHNFDGDVIDSIGETDYDPIKISTRNHVLDNYELVETGPDTGIFTGKVSLTGFCHDADGDSSTGDGLGVCPAGDDTNPVTSGIGPIDGLIGSDSADGLTVIFEFSEDETVVGSALIRWNIGDIQWVNGDYSVDGDGTIRVIDPDMNLNSEAVDSFNVDVWSDSDAGGVDIVLIETNDATGIFEGVVNFTDEEIESSGNLLSVSENDTITAEYEDNTLPSPYSIDDELDITATTIIGGIIIPDTTISIETDKTVYSHDEIIYLTGDALPSPVNTIWSFDASDVKIVDAFGNILETISVDQQVQIRSTMTNNLNTEQPFAYLVRIQDNTDAIISLAWITGSMSPGQTFSPALSWIPSENGDYNASIFFWKSIDDPIVLHPNISLTFNVGSDNSDQQMTSDDSTQIPISYYIQNSANNIVTIGEILPDETGLFLEQIVTTSNLFSSFGEYTVTANYGIATSETSFSLEEPLVQISVQTDLPSYYTDDQVVISGMVSDVSAGLPVTMHIQNPVGDITSIHQLSLNADGTFSTQIIASGPLWNLFGEYTVTANYGIATSETSFSLVPTLFCNDMTIDELIASGNYNVIDNRDGHLDGSKIKGTNGDDLILASDAGNVIHAKKGNDCVIGGAGDDLLRGGNGDDIMFGLGGNDRMIGGKQNDLLYGGEGNDKISGSKNNDQLFGGNGDDKINGGSGDDAISCGDGTDKANGGKGTDTATADCEKIKKVP